MLRYDDCSGAVSVFRQPSNNANGNTVDRQGRLVTCEHLGRRVTRTEHDGTITVLSDAYQGKRLNSPNDVVVKSDGSIWFTNPSYGILFDYEGKRAESEIGRCNVYRIDPQTAETTLVADDFEKPNGLAFTPDEAFLYIADTGITHMTGGPKHIRKLAVKGKTLGISQLFAGLRRACPMASALMARVPQMGFIVMIQTEHSSARSAFRSWSPMSVSAASSSTACSSAERRRCTQPISPSMVSRPLRLS